MTLRDRAVVLSLALVLVVLGAMVALPRPRPAPAAPAPSPGVSLPPPDVYREGVVGTPESITPVTARSRVERLLVGLVFSGLVQVGPEDGLEPDLAASWTADEEGRTWTFRLRPDATWQDGQPVTAGDVVYTVDVLKSPDATGASAASWAEVEVEAVDELTVRFTLATPIGGFLAALTQPLLPSHLLAGIPYADLATSSFARLPVGTGPYALTELDAEGAVLVPATSLQPPPEPPPAPSADSLATPFPSPLAGRPRPYLDRIEIRFFPDPGTLAAALRSGEVDGASGLPPDLAADLARLDGVDRLAYPTTTLATILLNLRADHPELRDARVRRALLAALDLDALVSGPLDGEGRRADALVPPGSWAYDPGAVDPVAFDRKAAAALLTQAGWTRIDGRWAAPRAKTPYALELLTVSGEMNPRLRALATAVAAAWAKAGLSATVTELPAAELGRRLRAGEFGAALLDIATGLEPDLFPLLASSQVRTSGSNLAGYQDPSLDRLLAAARTPGTAEERAAAWKALLAGLAQRRPMLPIAWDDDIVLVRGLRGAVPRLIAHPGDRFWDVLAWRLAADRSPSGAVP